MQHLFGALPAREAQRGGRGGTLQLAKGMVEAMGGEIRVTSRAGGGSEFVVDIPLGRPCGDSTKDSAARNAA